MQCDLQTWLSSHGWRLLELERTELNDGTAAFSVRAECANEQHRVMCRKAKDAHGVFLDMDDVRLNFASALSCHCRARRLPLTNAILDQSCFTAANKHDMHTLRAFMRRETGFVHVSEMRKRGSEICIALQDLELPALVTLEIIDECLPNIVSMFQKWRLITAVKHFRDRRAVAQRDARSAT
jgi:hypothetical protein